MKIAIYRTFQRSALDAFADGLKHHGIKPEMRRRGEEPIDCDVAVMWGYRSHRVIDAQRHRGRHSLILERGYIGDRFHWTSVGLNGLNGRATFIPCADGGERWERLLAPLMQPWREGGEHVLLIGQVYGDMSVANINIRAWYLHAAALAAERYGLPVRFRPHPQARRPEIVADVPTMRGELQHALAGAAVAVTWNSNTGVDAVLAGTPAVTCDPGAMAWDVAAHEIGETIRPDRMAWAHRMAWAQFDETELASGMVWERLLPLVA